MSVKRRRTVRIDSAYLESLKGMGKSPTALVAMILEGRICPLTNIEKSGRLKSMSMIESMFCSVKHRSENIGTSISTAANLILSGEEAHLSADEILLGLMIAEEKEIGRARIVSDEYYSGVMLI